VTEPAPTAAHQPDGLERKEPFSVYAALSSSGLVNGTVMRRTMVAS